MTSLKCFTSAYVALIPVLGIFSFCSLLSVKGTQSVLIQILHDVSIYYNNYYLAETSITVDDVTHVIDTGLMKEIRFDPESNISSLQEVFISRASGKQRSGRAGRVRPGHCWKLYSKEFFESSAICNYPVPEICRIPLEDVVLQVLLMKLGVPEVFLGKCLQVCHVKNW